MYIIHLNLVATCKLFRMMANQAPAPTFTILRTLGQGGFGDIYKVHCHLSNSTVALKIVKRSPGDHHDPPREIQYLLRCMNMHGIVQIHHYSTRPQEYLFSMSHDDDNVDIHEYLLRYGEMTEPQVHAVMLQLLGTLMDLQNHQIVHNDIKEENILISLATDEITLIDFGAAGDFNDNPIETFCGTPEYCPPEFHIYGSYKAHGINTWQYGVLLYSLLAGHVPFQSPLQIQLIDPPIDELPISAPAKNLLHACLVKNPTLRLPLADVCVHHWITENDENQEQNFFHNVEHILNNPFHNIPHAVQHIDENANVNNINEVEINYNIVDIDANDFLNNIPAAAEVHHAVIQDVILAAAPDQVYQVDRQHPLDDELDQAILNIPGYVQGDDEDEIVDEEVEIDEAMAGRFPDLTYIDEVARLHLAPPPQRHFPPVNVFYPYEEAEESGAMMYWPTDSEVNIFSLIFSFFP